MTRPAPLYLFAQLGNRTHIYAWWPGTDVWIVPCGNWPTDYSAITCQPRLPLCKTCQRLTADRESQDVAQ